MEQSPKFKEVLNYYRTNMWGKERVRNAVVAGWITASEYKLITREEYLDESEKDV